MKFHVPPQIVTREMLLYGAGPSMPYPSVIQARGQLAPTHTSEKAVEVCQLMGEMSRVLFGTENERTVVLPFGGTGGIESMMEGLVTPGAHVIIPETGLFSTRLSEMAAKKGAEVGLVQHEVGETVNIERVAEALVGHGAGDVLAFVLDETSRGMVTDAKALVRVAEEAGVRVLIDAVTSFPGSHILVDELGAGDSPAKIPLVVVSCGQKRIGGSPGTSPVTMNDAAWEIVKKSQPSTWLYDIPTMLDKLDKRAYHTTTDMNAMVATYEAMRHILEDCRGDVTTLFAKQKEAFTRFEAALAVTDGALSWVFPNAKRSQSLMAVTVKDSPGFVGEIITALDQNHGIEVSPGGAVLPGNKNPTPYFRIGLLAPRTLEGPMMARLFTSLHREMSERGVGFSLDAVMKCFHEG